MGALCRVASVSSFSGRSAMLVFDANECEPYVTTPDDVFHNMVKSGPATLVIYGRAPVDRSDLTSAELRPIGN